jgi:hypothetical protein
MHQSSLNLAQSGNALPPLSFARDPIGEVNDSLPVHPNLERPTSQDLWDDVIRKNQQRRKQPAKQPDNKRPGTKSTIDDFV